MTDAHIDHPSAFDLACRYILQQQPRLEGVVYVVLDCECVKMGGVDAAGNILSPLTLILSASAQRKDRGPRCRTCDADRGIDLARVVRHGIVWPKRESGIAVEKKRRQIGRKLFGPAYPGNSDDRIINS